MKVDADTLEPVIVLRRNAGAVQYVLADTPAGGVIIVGLHMETRRAVLVQPCAGLDDGIARFRGLVGELEK